MTVNQLYEITGRLVGRGKGDSDVAINLATFAESENGTIIIAEKAEMAKVQGADDSGPVGPKFPMLVITGGFLG